MAEQQLPFGLVLLGTFVAIASGIGGLITGAKGLATAKRADKKVGAFKKLDLRLRLTENLNVLHSDFDPLIYDINSIRDTRLMHHAVDWQLNIGMKNAWIAEMGRHGKELSEIHNILPKVEDFSNHNPEQLEDLIGKTHRAQLRVTKLKISLETKRRENEDVMNKRIEQYDKEKEKRREEEENERRRKFGGRIE